LSEPQTLPEHFAVQLETQLPFEQILPVAEQSAALVQSLLE
jgi:hypothetical protein